MNAQNQEDSEKCLCNQQRCEFLLEMYRQTSGHLGRHVAGIWQCVGVVGGALAVFALEPNKMLNDYACALVILLCGWLIATTLDASNWFNRNIAIITNIERLFLNATDEKLVHPFFRKHRPVGKAAEHFRIQYLLGICVGLLVLAYHFTTRVVEGLDLPLDHFDIPRALPYGVSVVVIVFCSYWNAAYFRKDKEFQEKSPGMNIS